MALYEWGMGKFKTGLGILMTTMVTDDGSRNNEEFSLPYDVINEFLAAQSNNQSLHYPPSTQMPIKCCDNQFIKAEKSRSAKF